MRLKETEKWPDWAERERKWVADAIHEATKEAWATTHPGEPWARRIIAGVDALADFRILFAEHKP